MSLRVSSAGMPRRRVRSREALMPARSSISTCDLFQRGIFRKLGKEVDDDLSVGRHVNMSESGANDKFRRGLPYGRPCATECTIQPPAHFSRYWTTDTHRWSGRSRDCRFALSRRQEGTRDIAGLRPYSPKLLSCFLIADHNKRLCFGARTDIRQSSNRTSQ